MKWSKYMLMSALILPVLPLPALAVTKAGNSSVWAAPVSNTSGTVERGGTITAVDVRGKTIAVDDVSYPLSASSLNVYSDDPAVAGSLLNLKKNMRVRFSTVKESYGGHGVVNEVWIMDPRRSPSQQKSPRKAGARHD